MHSDLLHLGPFTLRAFGLLMALGFLAAGYAAMRLARGTHRNADYLSTLVVWLMLAGVVGARLAYIAEHWSTEFAGQPGALFRIDQGGLMFYGGMAGAGLALALFARLRRERFLALTDLLLTVLPLGHAFGRLGCFMHGCCHGRVTDGPLGITFPRFSPAWVLHVQEGRLPDSAPRSLPVLPTQLFEAGANLVLFAVLTWLYRRRRNRVGLTTAAYLMGYAVIRFAVESLRGDQRQAVGPLSISQAISLAVFVLGLAILGVSRRAAATQTR
jgi:phosphatidylglycerol:prolipoprotein diacylglycerol transferase